jgi:hypothetical protein
MALNGYTGASCFVLMQQYTIATIKDMKRSETVKACTDAAVQTIHLKPAPKRGTFA